MDRTAATLGMIGFGEAGRAFAVAGGWAGRAQVHDRLTQDAATRGRMAAHYAAARVVGRDTTEAAVAEASVILSLVTADQALAAAEAAARAIAPGALYLDMNSVAPATKQGAARAIAAAGGQYLDVAVMSPVEPARLGVPLLLSGPEALAGADALTGLGFTQVRVVGSGIGQASAIKMIRSVMIKGVEALSAECMLAAQVGGVLDEVVASLDATWPGADWGPRADYNLDRMMVHGLRRAAEMQEVVRTLEDLGTGGAMSRATAERQRAIGRLGIATPPIGINAKISAVLHRKAEAA